MPRFRHPIDGLAEIIAELDRENDRACAIVAASLLDHFLQLAIMSRFKVGLSASDEENLFDHRSPLSGTASKIEVAHALNLLASEHRNDAIIVNRVRNRFAHHLGIRSFDHPEIIKLTAAFQLERGLRNAKGLSDRSVRESYIDVATYLVLALSSAAAEEVRPPIPAFFDS